MQLAARRAHMADPLDTPRRAVAWLTGAAATRGQRAVPKATISRQGEPMRLYSTILLSAVFAASASAATAQEMLTATADPIAAVMQDAGLQAEVGTDNSGDPMITSSAAGANFFVLFYGCTAGKECTSVQLNACYDLPKGTTLDIVNTWNKDMRYGKASINEDLDPCLMMDIDMMAGTSPATFKNSLQNWSQILGKFNTAIGFQ